MILKYQKLHDSAAAPIKREGDCGYDLTATWMRPDDLYLEYGTSLAIAIPAGYVGLLFPRSSVSKTGLIMANCVGVIDQNYRGELKIRFKKIGEGAEYEIGERVAQLLIVPIAEPEWQDVGPLDTTNRGTGGFGSTGT